MVSPPFAELVSVGGSKSSTRRSRLPSGTVRVEIGRAKPRGAPNRAKTYAKRFEKRKSVLIFKNIQKGSQNGDLTTRPEEAVQLVPRPTAN